MPRSPDYDDRRDESGRVGDRAGAAGAPILEPNEARQGAPHHNVRLVLIGGLAAVLIAFAVIYLAYFG